MKNKGFNYSSKNYDFQAERGRYNYPTIDLHSVKLNRGTSEPVAGESSILRDDAELESAVVNSLFPTTLSKKSAILDISLPYAGHYYCSKGGIYFDADVGVGQKLIDDQHPEVTKMLATLMKHNVLVRRESITNDVMYSSSSPDIKTPQDLANLMIGIANGAFPNCAPYKVYFSSSGALSVEAAIKIACRSKHYNLINQYGYEFEKKLMADLRIPFDDKLVHPEDKDPLYCDYPFYFIAMKGAFHGRTMGALALTHFRPVQKRGYPSNMRVKHITFNGDTKELSDLIDTRSLKQIYDDGDEVYSLISNGRIPRELIAGLVVEPFQGEAGYIIADKKWLKEIARICKSNDINIIADEVQSFARTGKVFASQYFDIEPDIITISKASVVSMTIASSKFTNALPKGWHSCTWGGGKVLDNNLAWTTINAYLNYKDPVFLGHTYIENQNIKAEYISAMFAFLADKHPKTLLKYSGLGTMWGFTVKYRDQVCLTALKNGLKLLTVGITKDVSAIRALFLSDILTKEIDSFCYLLDKTLSEVEKMNGIN